MRQPAEGAVEETTMAAETAGVTTAKGVAVVIRHSPRHSAFLAWKTRTEFTQHWRQTGIPFSTIRLHEARLRGLTSYANLTAPANQPPSGSLDYAEYFLIFLGNNDFSIGANVTGEASSSVLFANHSISREATNFLGRPNDENGTPQVVCYLGTIAITDGSLTQDANGKAAAAAAAAFDIVGTLDYAVNTFVINNTLIGVLYGKNGEGLNARQTGMTTDSTINGGHASYDQATLRAQLVPATP
jgi:hypothetical protein